MSAELTFILPTRNRKDFVVRAVESCLQTASEKVDPHVLIIDGMSTDGSFELLSEKYQNNSKIRIVRKEPIGFQRTAYYGALEVETEYATYMYDDDILSPFYGDMIEKMLDEKRDFVMGYGKVFNVNQTYPFPQLDKISKVPKEKLLQAYFGIPKVLDSTDMPVSPICLVGRTDFLKRWVNFSQAFAKKSEFRNYFMIEQNIGPDEILFMSNILNQKENVLLAEHIVGQFSEHQESMSVGYGTHHLRTGYWIGKIWGLERLFAQGYKKVAAQCSAYLLADAFRLFIEMIALKKSKWIFPLLGEVGGILKMNIENGVLLRMVANLIPAVYRRLQSFYRGRFSKPQAA